MRSLLMPAVLALFVLLPIPVSAQLFPANPYPAPPARPAPSPYASFDGLWGRSNPEPPTAIGLSVSEYGVIHITWRAADDPPGRIATGKASGWLPVADDTTLRGSISETTDSGVIAPGPITVTLVSPSVLHLTQADRTWTLCKAVIPAPQPEPPCIDP